MIMKPIDKINKQINLINRVSKAKEAIDNLRINWETDVEKMPFDNLLSGNMVKGCKYLRMDKIKIESYLDKEQLFNNTYHQVERVVNLIELINSNHKIIPPMCVYNYDLIDGVKVVEGLNDSNRHEYRQVDGNHRKMIAAFMQLPEIPVVLFERLNSYMFTPDKWMFEEKPITEKTKHGHQTTGSYIEATSNEGKIVTIELKNGSFTVEDNNLEYIKITVF